MRITLSERIEIAERELAEAEAAARRRGIAVPPAPSTTGKLSKVEKLDATLARTKALKTALAARGEATPPQTPPTLVEQFEKISDPAERSRFFRQHGDKLALEIKRAECAQKK